MDFPKFMAIVAQRELYFVSLPQLDDPFEGHIPRQMVNLIRHVDPSATDDERDHRHKVAEHNLAAIQNFRQIINVSCWHMNDTESDAMWQLYMPSGQGIAIRTTFGRFRNAVRESTSPVHGGVVEYIDYDTHEVDHSNLYNWSILKRRSFSHENEFRAFVSQPPDNGHGIAINVDANELIDSVYVSPMAPAWHLDLLRNLTGTYDLDIPIHQSELYEHPMYYDENVATISENNEE